MVVVKDLVSLTMQGPCEPGLSLDGDLYTYIHTWSLSKVCPSCGFLSIIFFGVLFVGVKNFPFSKFLTSALWT